MALIGRNNINFMITFFDFSLLYNSSDKQLTKLKMDLCLIGACILASVYKLELASYVYTMIYHEYMYHDLGG